MVRSTCLHWKSGCDPVPWEYTLPYGLPLSPEAVSLHHCSISLSLSISLPGFWAEAWQTQRMKTQCSFHSNIFRKKRRKEGKKWNSTMNWVLNISEWVACSKQSVLSFVSVRAIEIASGFLQFQVLPVGCRNMNIMRPRWRKTVMYVPAYSDTGRIVKWYSLWTRNLVSWYFH